MNDSYINTGRTAQKEKTRQNIVVATQRLMDSGTDFTLEDVAKSAGISRATVYRYFSSVDVLSIEASLDLKTLSPEEIFNKFKGKDITETFLSIQKHYNQLSLDHESLFRTYLSAILNPTNSSQERGARRSQALSLVLETFDNNLSKPAKEKLITSATALMGIEAIIVTKDVRGLNNKQSLDNLRWGLEHMLKNLF